MLPFTLCSPFATMMQWNINGRTHIHSHGVANSVFLSGASPAACASFLLFRNQISAHIAPKAAKWKKERAQSMRLWMYDCSPCALRNVASFTTILSVILYLTRVAKHISCPLGGVFLWRQWELLASAPTLWPPADRDADVKPAMETRAWYLVSLSRFPSHCVLPVERLQLHL